MLRFYDDRNGQALSVLTVCPDFSLLQSGGFIPHRQMYFFAFSL